MDNMIFLDTSFILSYYNKEDSNNIRAVNLMKEMSNNKDKFFVISDYVFDECATIIFQKIKNKVESIKAIEDIRSFTELIFIDKEVFDESWELFKNQDKTRLSFTDCSIISMAKSNGIKEIVTFDQEFDKIEGIKILN